MTARLWAFTILIFIWFSAPAWAEAPRVVASIKPVHSLVAAVMDGTGVPDLLVNGNGSPHSYSLRPSEARVLSRADIVFWIGPDFETFLQKPLDSLASEAVRVSWMEHLGVRLLPGRTIDGGESSARDGHVWLDPANAVVMVRAITQTLQRADDENADLYADNAARTIETLENLDSELERMLVPVQKIPFITFHDALQYFETRYKLNAVGFVAVTPEQMSGAKHVAALTADITAQNPVCIFSEPGFASGLVQTLMAGTDLKRGTLDPEGAALRPGPDFYFDLMRGLADNLTACLSGTAVHDR